MYFSPNSIIVDNQIKVDGIVVISNMWECTQTYDVKPENKTPLWRPKRRWKDMIKIKIDFKQMWRQGVEQIQLEL